MFSADLRSGALTEEQCDIHHASSTQRTLPIQNRYRMMTRLAAVKQVLHPKVTVHQGSRFFYKPLLHFGNGVGRRGKAVADEECG